MPNRSPRLFVSFLALILIFTCAAAHALDNGLARTPPMGWNSWNKFACEGLNEKVVRETADTIVVNGMKDAGYQYVNLDDCWQTSRDADGNIVPDATKFPSGIKALADLHPLQGPQDGHLLRRRHAYLRQTSRKRWP